MRGHLALSRKLGCRRLSRLPTLVACTLLLCASSSRAQIAANPHARANADGIANLLRLTETVQRLHGIESHRLCSTPANLDELSLRQEILEASVSASLDADAAMAEMQNERALLMELRTGLENRRDHAVNLLGAANLITGTGLGIAVNAMQFSDSTANAGNAVGVGSGIASTLLSVIGIRKQKGSKVPIGKVPNMLAPLFGQPSALNSYYPPSVEAYLDSAPPTGDGKTATRLNQLKAQWQAAGRVPLSSGPAFEKQLRVLTVSENSNVKLTIDNLNDRIAMLIDVSGRVGLMKRDLADLMFTLRKENACNP
jgi:hypothetical protein